MNETNRLMLLSVGVLYLCQGCHPVDGDSDDPGHDSDTSEIKERPGSDDKETNPTQREKWLEDLLATEPCSQITSMASPETEIDDLYGCGGKISFSISGDGTVPIGETEYGEVDENGNVVFNFEKKYCPNDSSGVRLQISSEKNSYEIGAFEGEADEDFEGAGFSVALTDFDGSGTYTGAALAEDLRFWWREKMHSDGKQDGFESIIIPEDNCTVIIKEHPYTGAVVCTGNAEVNGETVNDQFEFTACWRSFGPEEEEEMPEGGW